MLRHPMSKLKLCKELDLFSTNKNRSAENDIWAAVEDLGIN